MRQEDAASNVGMEEENGRGTVNEDCVEEPLCLRASARSGPYHRVPSGHRSELCSTVETVFGSRFGLWRLEHHDHHPVFERFTEGH